MQTPANDTKGPPPTLNQQTLLPPVVLGLPAIIAGLFICGLSSDARLAPAFSTNLLTAIYVFWLFSVWQMHRVLCAQAPNYHVKPLAAVAMNIIAGPVAASLSVQLCSWLNRAMTAFQDLIGEVLPSSLPIANSAVALIDQYSALLAIAIACGAAVCSQVRIALYLRDFINERGGKIARHRTLLGAAVIGMALVIPGCLAVIGGSPMTTSIASANLDWNSRLLLISYVCALCAFAVLWWFNKRIAGALKAQPAIQSDVTV